MITALVNETQEPSVRYSKLREGKLETILQNELVCLPTLLLFKPNLEQATSITAQLEMSKRWRKS